MKVVTGFESAVDPLGYPFVSWAHITIPPEDARDREEGVRFDPLLRIQLEEAGVSLLFVRAHEYNGGRYRIRFTAYNGSGKNVTSEVCAALKPSFHPDALERLLVAIRQLSNADGVHMAVQHESVLQDWVSEQVVILRVAS